MKKINLILIILMLFVSSIVMAAQDATVTTNNATIKSDPRENANTLEFLPLGSEVRISSQPFEGGWFKIRSKSGAYGWIHESFLSVGKANKLREQAQDQLPNEPSPIAQYKERAKTNVANKRIFTRVFYGMQFQNATDINDIFSFTEFKSISDVGGEVGIYLNNPRWAILMRVEMLYKDVVAKETASGITYNIGLRSYPIMGGIEYTLTKDSPIVFSAAAMVGFAPKTSLNVQAISLTAPNSLIMTDTPMTTLLRGNLTKPVGKMFSVFAETSYRYLVSKELSTAEAASMRGGQVFIKNNRYQNRIIDLTGIEVGIGVGFTF